MAAGKYKIPSAFTDEVYMALEKLERRIYFHWDLTRDILELDPADAGSDYELPTCLTEASTQLWLSELIHPADITWLHRYLHMIFHYVPRYTNRTRRFSGKIRLRGRRQYKYIWSEIHIITYFADHGAVAAFGSIHNIHKQKIWQERIEREVAYDKLTGLLNKDTVKKRIEQALRVLSPQDDQAALMVIDADGFKNINDSFGHLFGDAVLADMGLAINQNFRQSDIKGRIGGDEFVVFFHNASGTNAMKSHCEQLIAKLKRSYRRGNASLPFSISIGIAQYPLHGTTYEELFKHADRALYKSKSEGGGCYTVYQNSLFDVATTTNRRNPDSFADQQQHAFNDNMVECIFMLLYENNNPKTTIKVSLEMFGKRFNMDRVAIDSFNPDTNQYTNRFEWLSPNGFSLRQQNHAKDISGLILAHNSLLLHQYKPTPYGVMAICSDTTQLEEQYRSAAQTIGLGSFAHCLISHGSDTLGCIGCESTQAPRELSQEVLRSLSIFAIILGNILLPCNSDASIKRENKQLRDILNYMKERIYIVDKITMKPVYYNQTIRQLLPYASSQQPCYQLFHHRDSICPGCPVSKLSKGGSEYIEVSIDNWIVGNPICTRAYNLHWDAESEQCLAMVIQEPIG